MPALNAGEGIFTDTFYWDILTVSSKFDGGLIFQRFDHEDWVLYEAKNQQSISNSDP